MIIAMLHILLLILKIIGITVGILLGIIILALCLALFVPIRYRIEAQRSEEEGSPPIEVVAKITWLLHFINIRVLYSTELSVRLRVLFITIFRIPAKKKKNKSGSDKENKSDRKNKSDKKDDKKNKSDKIKNNQKNASGEDVNDQAREEAGDSRSEANTQPKNNVHSNSAGNDNADHSGQQDSDINNEEDDEQKLSIKDKLLKIWDFFKNIWYTIKGICARIKEIFENIEYYLEIIKSDTFKSAFSLCKDELGSVFSYIKPRKLDAQLVIGTGDPASTGQILSYYYGILYPFIGNHVIVTGDFDRKRIEGTAFIKGKMRLFTFLKAAARIYFSKDIKKLLKLFKKEDE